MRGKRRIPRIRIRPKLQPPEPGHTHLWAPGMPRPDPIRSGHGGGSDARDGDRHFFFGLPRPTMWGWIEGP